MVSPLSVYPSVRQSASPSVRPQFFSETTHQMFLIFYMMLWVINRQKR